jgi:DNA primase
VYGIIEDRQRTLEALQGITFEERELPAGAEFVEPDSEYADYLQKRCVPMNFPFMKDPLVTRRSIVIPFTYRDQVVGWTKRFLDDRNPRYLSDAQPGYVFNVDSIKDSWTQVIVTEGIFDALSIGGVAVMHNDINDAQARLIRNLGREITVVPDQDQTGLDLIDRALELGWAVSIPDWGDCKDVNDAVIKHGRLATLITIMQARETSRIKIELRKRQLVKRLQKL